jgi:ADP-heptose:LPS heptosyltransferase
MKIETPTQILVRRRAAIGDVIMSTAVVRELKRLYGDSAVIDVATDNISIYRNNPHIRNIFPVDTVTADQYDVYINLDNAYENNPENNYMDSYFDRALGTINYDKSVELFPSLEDTEAVEQDLYFNSIDKFIVVHMRNWHWPAKNITMSTWFSIYEKLFAARTDFKVVCVGGPYDFFVEDHPLFYDARTKYNEQKLKFLCDRSRAFVGIDSGPYWCAAASDTHIVALLTHLKPERILPYRAHELGFNCTAIPTLEDCAGCNDNQTRPVSQIVCAKGNTPCNDNFNTEAIAQAILDQLK